jgi:GGDEF domain-containing protein
MTQFLTVPVSTVQAMVNAVKAHLVDRTSQEELLGVCMNAGGLVARSDRSVAFWLDKEGQLEPSVRCGPPMIEAKMAARRLADQVIANEGTTHIPDLVQKRWVIGAPGHAPHGMVGIPLRLNAADGGKLIGVMCFEREAGPIDAEVVTFLEWIGEMVATYIRHGLKDRQNRMQFDQLLDQVNRLGATLQLDSMSQRQAVTDPDSGLVNKAFLEHHCPIVVAMAQRHKFPVSAVLAEIAMPNAAAGLSADDRKPMLMVVARHILRCARSCDTVAQMAEGTLFTLAPHTDHEGAMVLADRIRSAVSELKWPGPGGPVDIKIGVAEMRDGQDGNDLLVAAEAALHVATFVRKRH